MAALVRLSDVVHEALWLSGLDENHYMRFLQLAQNGYRELNHFHMADGVKEERLYPDDNFIVPFPEDFMDWVSVAVAIGGQKVTLTQRQDMVMTTTLIMGQPTRVTEGEGGDIGVGGNMMPGGIENVYGYFAVDYANRRFILLLDKKRPIYLTYTFDGITSANDYIPIICKDALVAYIMWKSAYFDREAPMNDRQFKKYVYDEEVQKLRATYSFTLDGLRDALNS